MKQFADKCCGSCNSENCKKLGMGPHGDACNKYTPYKPKPNYEDELIELSVFLINSMCSGCDCGKCEKCINEHKEKLERITGKKWEEIMNKEEN